jgi:hypothetical protein
MWFPGKALAWHVQSHGLAVQKCKEKEKNLGNEDSNLHLYGALHVDSAFITLY